MDLRRSGTVLGTATAGVVAFLLLAPGHRAPARTERSAASPLPAPSPLQGVPPRAPSTEPLPPGTRPVDEYRHGIGSRPRTDGTARRLARAVLWVESLHAAAALPDGSPEERLATWKEAFALATDPCVRQNLIFQAALVFPFDLVRPWLEDIRRGEDPADAEDALLALAFSGEPDARAAFADLARTPEDPALLRAASRFSPLALRPDEARRVLRSQRAIEVLDREPYFQKLWYSAWYRWQPHPVDDAAAWTRLESELLRHWLRRYPRHDGSDDMAYRIARAATDPVDAARWFGRAATWPDQDMVDHALFAFVATVERYVPVDAIDQLAHEDGLDTPNRMLLLYIRLRRVAADRDIEAALREAGARAGAEPDSSIGRAWRRRWSVPPPRGLGSGVVPLPAGDPLFDTHALPRDAPGPAGDGRRPVRLSLYRFPPRAEGRSREETKRDPPRERLLLDEDALARQFRIWETLAELERRARAADRAARSDLLYKQAAVLYHERDALFPVWGAHTLNFAGVLRIGGAWAGDRDAVDEAVRRFRDRALSFRRAIGLFDRIEAEDTSYAGMDRVRFSRAMAYKKLLDVRPFRPWDDEERHALIRTLVEEFERCAATHPDSPLAGPARRAAAWWRREHEDAWVDR